MSTLAIDIPDAFLLEEVRNDYKISCKMKKVWAVEIDLLKKLDEVCKKYNIKYYATAGTLLGAVRHNGFIPWDDDIDVVMKREDYNRLFQLSYKEFGEPYFLQTVYNENMYIYPHAQLRNSSTTAYRNKEIGTPINKGIFIDIFPMDKVPDNRLKLNIFLLKVELLWKVLQYKNYSRAEKHSIKGIVWGNIIAQLYRFVDYKKIFKKYEKLCGKYNNTKYSRIGHIAFSRRDKRYFWEEKWFDSQVILPFEFTNIEVPGGYDNVLRMEFGNDYMIPKKALPDHGTVIYEPDVSYKNYFKNMNKEA